MTETLQFGLFTLLPATALAVAGGISIQKIRDSGERRLLLLVGVLVFMLAHQLLEGRTFFLDDAAVSGLSEWIETTANLLAASAVFYGTSLFERERELSERLRESESRYRALTEHAPVPILVVREEEIRYANGAAGTLFSAESIDDLTGADISTAFRNSGGQSITSRIDGEASEDGEATVFEERLVDFDGAEHVVLVSGWRAAYDGQPATFLVVQDVTEQRTIRRELEQTRQRLETAFESSNDAIFLIDPDGEEILEANAQAAEMLRYDRDELVGMSPFRIHPHEESTFANFLDQVRADGGKRTDSLSCVRKDGVELPAEVSASTTTVDGTECILAAVRDITERERRRRQIKVLGRVLRHNVRNDMNVVVGQAEFIESRTDDEAIVEAVERIQEIGFDLVNLSQRVRDLQSTIQTDSFEMNDVSVKPVVDSVVSEIRENYPEADIETDVPEGTTVRATDNGALAWALSNLVENAIEHNDDDSPWVAVRVEETDHRRGDWVAVSVADDGPGIPEEERVAATDPADQTDLAHATGIGLWVVGRVVTAFDGDVSFRDREGGRGTVVTLYLRGNATPERAVESA